MAPVVDNWHFRYPHLRRTIRPWSPRKAEWKFLAAYARLNPLARLRRSWVRVPLSWG